MNNTQNRKQSATQKPRRFIKEKWTALFGILMVTALPLLLVTLGDLNRPVQRGADVDEEQILMLRHEESRATERLPFGKILALSLAATNASDTPMESLAAQAVALRSRGVWWSDYCPTVGKADCAKLCDNSSHGLPYLSQGELMELYGEDEGIARLERSAKAVESTRGLVLCYDGKVIPALLHHSSPGNTRSSDQLAWVRSVTSPESGKQGKYTYTVEETRLCLAAAFGVELSQKPWEWSMLAEADGVGWVKTVQIGELTVSGDAFAAALSLPSPCFTLQIQWDGLVVTTVGEGSGCGLSREGATLYAGSGLTRWEILGHYFPECTVEALEVT